MSARISDAPSDLRSKLDDSLERGAVAVRGDHRAYAAALAEATALLNADRSLSSTDRIAFQLAIIDRLATAALQGAIDAGGGDVLAAALREGRFDAFLQPESRADLLRAAAL